MRWLRRFVAALRQDRGATLVILVAVVTLLVGFNGWIAYFRANPNITPYVYGEAFFRAVKAFTLAGDYEQPNVWNHDWRLYMARWGGTFVAFAAVLQAAILLFFRPLARLRAGLRKGHVVIVGDSPLARAAGGALIAAGRKVSQHSGEQFSARDGVLVLPSETQGLSRLLRTSLSGSERVIVALGTDSATADMARDIALAQPNIPVFALLDDPWLTTQIAHDRHTRAKGDLLTGVSADGAMARAVLSAYPPYLQARSAEASRIHALIVGFDGLGCALLVDMLNSSLVTFLDRPMFTIVDPNAKLRRSAFLARHPGLDEHVDLAFIDAAIDEFDQPQIKSLRARTKDAPVTSVYIATDPKAAPLAHALAVQVMARREGLLHAPIFLRASENADLSQITHSPDLPPRTLVPFGSYDQVIKASGLIDPVPDAAPRALHEAYETFMSGKPAQVPWQSLPERFRTSNRRAVQHIPAKLASAGYALDGHLSSGKNAPTDLPKLKTGHKLCKDADTLDKLGRLEHDRWMMDRWLEGWRYAPTRDDDRLLHPDLIPFDDLTAEIQGYDIKFVEFIDQFLQREPNGVSPMKHKF
ncbi:MAG: RyR domain-containing protein [Sulfitobacter sp.]